RDCFLRLTPPRSARSLDRANAHELLRLERSHANLSQHGKSSVTAEHRPPVTPPSLWPRVDFRCFNQFAIDLKRLATANANDHVANARIGKANPTLLVYCDAAFASDLLIGKAIASESCWQWLVERLFVTASLSPSARFDSGNVYQL